MRHSNNVAARMGRWSAEHRKTAIFGWLAFVILAVALGTGAGLNQIDASNGNVGQAGKADQLLKHAGFKQAAPLTEIVVIQSKQRTISDPTFRATVSDVIGAVAPSPNIHALRSPLDRANHGLVSADGRVALVEWEMNGTQKTAEKNVDALTAQTAAVAKAHPDFYVGEAGAASSTKALNKLFSTQLGQAGMRSLPLTLLILALVFGSLVAGLVPLALGLTSVLATIGLVSLESHLVPMDQNVTAVILLIGLAVGVDYSLFYLRREREERAGGRSEGAALAAAAATSGRSVLISGATVIIAMAGMLLSGSQVFIGFSLATMTVVAVAMLGSLTVLPAVLSKLGDRVEKGRIPLLGRLRRPAGESRVWAKLLAPALRRPVASIIAAVAVLLVLAIPALNLHLAQSGLSAAPHSEPVVRTGELIQDALPGQANPAIVAVKTNTDSPAFKRAVASLRATAATSAQVQGPLRVETNAGHTVARISIPIIGDGVNNTSTRALLTVRNELLPATIGTLADVSYAVTGDTAAAHDDNQQMRESLPIVFAFVLTFAFVLMLASFRSIVIAAISLVCNLLSVAAAYGVMVAVFQYGWGERLLDFKANGGITPWLPMFMFVILFGLSMDYQVFILSRIREAYDSGLDTKEAVARGIKSTAGTVTSAAIVMVGVFLIFATLPIIDMKEMGVGLAAAVLIDATVVRAMLLPAMMRLLGEQSWYLPRWLGWLPRIEPVAPPAPAAA
ncbi:MAG TPA: MMPL family transporter [Gaiellales bacterium]|nr:MMPL family transporter [Gaiellales bacterium]